MSYGDLNNDGTIATPEILEENNYYPFGLKHKDNNNVVNSTNPGLKYKYKYNGKELQDENIGGSQLNLYDYGARNYDPALGRWHTMDGKGELYFGTSPYVYASNTPVQAIDPDGNLVIFINGQHTGSGGSPEYWRTYERELRYSSSLSGSISYPLVEKSAFDKDVMDQLGDHNALYRDGASHGFVNTFFADNKHWNMSSSNRINAGFDQGKADAKMIIKNLARDKTTGEIVETIKIITHSMGGAYGKGYVKALKEYIKTLPKEQQAQIKITLVADFDPFQGASLKADKDIYTQQFTHIGYLAEQKQSGSDYYKELNGDHSISTFLSSISNLQEGSYKWNGTSWICTTCK